MATISGTKIEVTSSETREVVKKATGEIFRIPEVKGYAHGIDRYPVAIKFGVNKGEALPAPGFYELDAGSLFVGKYDALSVRSNLTLKPVKG